MKNKAFKKVTVSAPGRIDLSGGATDWCGYHTLAMAINLRAYAIIERLDDLELISISIGDLKEEYKTPKYGTPLDLFKACIELSGLKGFKILYKTELPKHSSLGGSAPLTVATLFGLKQLFNKDWSLYYIAELAQRAETFKLETVNGYQDQFTAAFGGLIFMDFRGKSCQKGIYSRPIEEEPYTVVEDISDFVPRFKFLVAIPEILDITSNQANTMVSQRYLNGDEEIVNLIKEKAALTQEIKKAIIGGKNEKIVDIINKNQAIIRKFGWVSKDNERIQREAFDLGALAVKNTGAGFAGMAIVCRNEKDREKIAKGLNGVAEYMYEVEMAGGVRVESRV